MQGELCLGIDVGSTTVKCVLADPDTCELFFSDYRRHHAKQEETVRSLLEEICARYGNVTFFPAVCGSGGKPIADSLGIPYIQEVVANAAAVRRLYPGVRTAVELGGQDAKVVFFYQDEETGTAQVSDMRMNGSCAGGTGAFIDEMATLLGIQTEAFETLAARGTQVFDISGRCGVFAKTDIQPLLIQGASKEDIALSVFHAIAKQTIGGLSQGLELSAPVIFEGGPLTFNPTLVRVFKERLSLSDAEAIVPEHPETIVALGTALSAPCTSDAWTAEALLKTLSRVQHVETETAEKPFFETKEEFEAFTARHDAELLPSVSPEPEDGELSVWMGVDSGSTTSKIVLMDDKEQVVDTFYANNNGNAIGVVREGILELEDRYLSRGIRLRILGVGTTGYGENMLEKALSADYHTVETVAHAAGCLKFYPQASFILDIGGQDMKAIWLKDGIITNIMLNEACSSGCGSFLENFAHSLDIPVTEIADAAFRSRKPAKLGSRCTVFMNSTIIHEQREGRDPDDIMAGLSRSIIENVFTKVVRIPNPGSLGDCIVVQGGTFRNRAVLRALEEYLGKEVHLAPYPGEMGAYGAALLTKRNMQGKSCFIGTEGVQALTVKTETGVSCPHCANHCSRTIMTFSNGGVYVSGNRCERGEVVQAAADVPKGRDLFAEREQRLFRFYDCAQVAPEKHQTIGLPRVLEFWDSMPFWSTFFRALGYDVVFSHPSSQKLYESGLGFVASDTICFPAKLVHGHIKDLADRKVNRIFMPYVMHMPPEGVDQNSPYVCSVVQGYPLVVRSSQQPAERYGIPFDTPIFHWFNEKARPKQITAYAVKTLGVTEDEAKAAFAEGEKALLSFRSQLVQDASGMIARARNEGRYVVVLAGRPYHSDQMVSHRISKLFSAHGVDVIPADSLPGLDEVNLKNTRVEITNNFHTRMLASAVLAAQDEAMEYVQLVSFGCGHDAVLSDEIVRIFDTTSDKSPLVLKVDESEAQGSLRIRVQSFLETVEIRRRRDALEAPAAAVPLPAPSPAKFYRKDKKRRTILLPNISHEVSILLQAVIGKEGYTVKRVPLGGPEEIQLGKRYVHNDICFPAQMVIGELIGELKRGNYDQDEVAVGMVKFQCDCRMSHYAGLLRKGLDAAGFDRVPIVTTDMTDSKDMHPGVFILGIPAVLEAVWVFMMLDMLTQIVRQIRPYELHPGETAQVYEDCVNSLAAAIQKGIPAAKKAFAVCIERLQEIPYDRSQRKPRVLVTGELLVTYHPGSNYAVEAYLEKAGMETIFPRVTDQLRKDFQATKCEIKDYDANIFPYPQLVTALFDAVQASLEKIASRHPLYEKEVSPVKMYQGVSDIIPETLSCGEGWLMAAEIDHYARQGVRSFVILQPFGCLPNHICGRGVVKQLKNRYPGIQILPLDLDPDTSFANVENRLQMLIQR